MGIVVHSLLSVAQERATRLSWNAHPQVDLHSDSVAATAPERARVLDATHGSNSPELAESIALLLVTSGRVPYLRLCVRSFRAALRGSLDVAVVVDTSLTPLPPGLLASALALGKSSHHIALPGADLRTALEAGWSALDAAGVTWVLHVEEDFLFVRRVEVDRLARSLSNATRSQALLLRQRWYENEYRHRTMLDHLRDSYAEGPIQTTELDLRVFSFNPSLYRLRTVAPIAANLESTATTDYENRLSEALVEAGYRAVVTATSSRPAVLHLGAVVTRRHRELAQQFRWVGVGYTIVHVKRTIVVLRRHVRAIVRPRPTRF